MSPSDPPPAEAETRPDTPVTLKTLRRMASRDEPFACLACYDATTARWLERAGVHVLLAGDSAAQVVLGLERTIEMPLDFAVHITRAVRNGAPRTLVMADMPFMSYHRSIDDAMGNAGRFMTEGGADAVKLETDETQAPLVDRLTRAGVPVCAHIGCRPQASSVTGGPVAAGRTRSQIDRIVRDARALEDAGAVLILIEAVPPDATRAVLDATDVPIIGIGAGTDCHGQILVVNDLVGLTDAPPRFAEPVAAMGESLLAAGREWVSRVRNREIGGRAYSMRDDDAAEKAAYTRKNPTNAGKPKD